MAATRLELDVRFDSKLTYKLPSRFAYADRYFSERYRSYSPIPHSVNAINQARLGKNVHYGAVSGRCSVVPSSLNLSNILIIIDSYQYSESALFPMLMASPGVLRKLLVHASQIGLDRWSARGDVLGDRWHLRI